MARYYPVMKGQDENITLTQIVGHLGEDWGSGAYLAGYNFGYDFAIAMTTNSIMGMNCSIKGE